MQRLGSLGRRTKRTFRKISSKQSLLSVGTLVNLFPAALSGGRSVFKDAMNSLIPVYQADGSLYASVSEQQLARLELAGLVSRVVRHHKGHINRAILFTRTGDPKPTAAGYVMGTRYSFKESLGHGETWDLTHLGGNHGGKNYAPTEARAAFGQVVADCTSPRKPSLEGTLQSTRSRRPARFG